VGFLAAAAVAAVIIAPAKLTMTQRSDPGGIVETTTSYYDPGTTVTVTTPPVSNNGYRFAYWKLNGVRKADAYGISVTSFSFSLTANSEAIAVYLPETQASAGDGVPDWYKMFYYGTTNISGSSDTDGDGRNLAQEYAVGGNPVIPDTAADGGVVEGGISRRRGDLVTMVLSPAYVHVLQSSDPGGVVASDTWVTNGTTISTVNAPTDYNGYKFGGWEVNGVRQTDLHGMSLTQATFTADADTVAVARYFPANAASAGDGVPDWYKYYYYGTTDISGSSDTDGDGWSLSQEFAQGSNPRVPDNAGDGGLREGGVSRRRAEVMTLDLANNLVHVTQYSDPGGIIWTDAWVTNGNTVTTVNAQPDYNGYKFDGWLVNGVRQTDANGMALTQVSFTASSDTVAVASYLPANQISGGDGVPDWYKMFYYGTTDISGTSDTDGDGRTLAQEYAMGANPVIPDSASDGGVIEGGISRRRAEPFVVNYQLIPVYDGWTWVSFSVLPADRTFDSLLGNKSVSNDDTVVGANGSATYYNGVWYPSSPDFQVEAGAMYEIGSGGTKTLVATGQRPDTVTVNLVSGWNWIGCPDAASTTLTDMLAGVSFSDNDMVISQNSQVATFYHGSWYMTTGRGGFPIFPGMGYLLYLNSPQTVPLK
jgi:hypothetical protein